MDQRSKILSIIVLVYLGWVNNAPAQTVALWLFDEPIDIYPSCVLNDAGPNDYPMVIGPGGQVVTGKFGNALEPLDQPAIDYPVESVSFGLKPVPVPEGRTVEPMTWMNAHFCALMTSGEKHLRKEVRFVQPTKSKLNLGDFDWTVEFWYQPTCDTGNDGVVFEIGTGPRGENDDVTRLVVNRDQQGFTIFNKTGGTELFIPSNSNALNPKSQKWHHFAFVYSAEQQQLVHYVDGNKQELLEKCRFKSLIIGAEDYFSVGRDGLWHRPLPGRIDELRFSKEQVYRGNFKVPGSLSPDQWMPVKLQAGVPLLFARDYPKDAVIQLANRKYVFIDAAIIEKMENIQFTANPPRLAECVIDSIDGAFRKHVSVIEDENGLIRLYYGGTDDCLEVMISGDGIHWQQPDLGHGDYHGRKNVVIPMSSAMGNVFIDPNAPAEARWKYVSGSQDRGIYVFYSPDGWQFNRLKTAAIPVRSGSQTNMFYDDQRVAYVGYHRSDFGKTIGGKTQREFGLSIVYDLMKPWPFRPVSQIETWEAAKTKRLREPQPWYLDNGPLTPGGLGIEYPIIFAPKDGFDPDGTDIYVPKAMKYPWAPDTYVAFPLLYFHYEGDGGVPRQILAEPGRLRGSGPVETQLAVSRDGVHWQRFPRPAYVGIGKFGAHDIHQSYFAHGMIRRGDEIWQYCFSETRYHSSWLEQGYDRAVYRFIQRLDGFVSADTPYETEGIILTKPFLFKGNCLELNIDTDATGYAQVGFLDERGKPIPGFSVDDCVYINGDFINTRVEWIKNQDTVTIPHGKSIEDVLTKVKTIQISTDVSALQGRPVQLVFRLRGTKLYAMQFVEDLK